MDFNTLKNKVNQFYPYFCYTTTKTEKYSVQRHRLENCSCELGLPDKKAISTHSSKTSLLSCSYDANSSCDENSTISVSVSVSSINMNQIQTDIKLTKKGEKDESAIITQTIPGYLKNHTIKNVKDSRNSKPDIRCCTLKVIANCDSNLKQNNYESEIKLSLSTFNIIKKILLDLSVLEPSNKSCKFKKDQINAENINTYRQENSTSGYKIDAKKTSIASNKTNTCNKRNKNVASDCTYMSRAKLSKPLFCNCSNLGGNKFKFQPLFESQDEPKCSCKENPDQLPYCGKSEDKKHDIRCTRIRINDNSICTCDTLKLIKRDGHSQETHNERPYVCTCRKSRLVKDDFRCCRSNYHRFQTFECNPCPKRPENNCPYASSSVHRSVKIEKNNCSCESSDDGETYEYRICPKCKSCYVQATNVFEGKNKSVCQKPPDPRMSRAKYPDYKSRDTDDNFTHIGCIRQYFRFDSPNSSVCSYGKREATTATRISDKYDVRPLKFLMTTNKTDCSCQSDSVMCKHFRQIPTQTCAPLRNYKCR